MCSDVREQGQASEQSRVGEVISVGKVFLTEEGGDLLLQVTHTGQHGPTTQPADLTEVEQIVVVHVHLVHQYLELEVVKAVGEDGVDNLHHDTHDINDTQGLLLYDAVHLVDGLSVSGSLTVTH